MVPLNWLFGLGFWAAYLTAGLVFCTFYMRAYAPRCYKVIVTGMKRPQGRDYWDVDGVSVGYLDIIPIVLVSVFLWPIGLALLAINLLVFLFAKSAVSILFAAVRNVAKKVPEIDVKNPTE